MKISAISYQDFTGKKANKMKTAAAAFAIAASPLAAQEADAQIYPIAPYHVKIMPAVPSSFVVGNLKNFDYNKSMKEVFDELDINGNGVISAKEVIRTEANNWNRFNLVPFNSYQAQNTYNNFNTLSALYNEDDSNVETINYNEYKEIVNDYAETKKMNNFMSLMYLLMKPYHQHSAPHYIPHNHPVPHNNIPHNRPHNHPHNNHRR